MDDPGSASRIPTFVAEHNLNTEELAKPLSESVGRTC